jgi:hypothetical protein
MAFVPGFEHDVFISYAHGDDRDWINSFLDRLRPALNRLLLGSDVWIDKRLGQDGAGVECRHRSGDREAGRPFPQRLECGVFARRPAPGDGER